MTREEFLCEMAWQNTGHNLGSPKDYGLQSFQEMYNLITGDTAFGELPAELQEDIGSLGDLENMAEDFTNAYHTAAYTLESYLERKQYIAL